MIESYGYSLLNTKQYEIAMQLLNVYDEFSGSADFIFMIALVLMNNGRFKEAINEFLKATKKKESKMGKKDFLTILQIAIFSLYFRTLVNYYKLRLILIMLFTLLVLPILWLIHKIQ